MKIIDEEIKKALSLGADYVLVVGRIPNVHPEKCLIEPLTLEELSHIPEDLKVVWNSRDLDNGGMKTETFEEARKIFLIFKIISCTKAHESYYS